MRSKKSRQRFFGLCTLFLMASVVLAGCGNEDGITGTNPVDTAGLELVADPLDGVLDATEGYTPAETGPRVDRLAEALGLSEEQKLALAEAYAEFRVALADLREQVRGGDLAAEDARAQAEVLREAFEAELQLILTPEQYDLLQEMRSGRDGTQRPIRDRISRWVVWLDTIGADEAQTAAVLDAVEVLRTGIHELRLAVRAGELPGDEAREAAMELRDEFDAALQSILTSEQYEQLMELRPDAGAGSGNRDHHNHDQGGDDDHGGGGDDDQGQGGGEGHGHGGGGRGNS